MSPPHRRPGFHAACFSPARPAQSHPVQPRLARPRAAQPSLVAPLCLPLLLCLPAWLGLAAQTTTTGALHGRLPPGRIPTGHISTGQTADQPQLLLRNPETGESQPISVDRDGTFLVPALQPGAYLLSGPGLPPTPITIHLSETTEYPATTTAENAGVALTAADPGTQTGTRPGLEPDQDDDGLLSAYALPSTQNTTLVDGVSLTQAFHSTPVGTGADPAPDPEADSDSAELSTGPSSGLSRGRHAGAAYTFSSASIREFHVTPGVASAASGGTPATIALLTRSGSPHLHGSGLFLLRSQAFAATNPFSLATTYRNGISSTVAVKPHDLRETYAATLGGPVPRTPLFFFYAFDAQRRNFPAVSSPQDPAFYTLTAIQQALLRTRGVSTAATQSALGYLASLTGETPRSANQSIHFARLDLRPGLHSDWRPRVPAASLEYNRLRWNHPAGLTEAPVVAAARNSIGNSTGSADAVVLRLTSTARRANQFRFQLARDLQFESPQNPLPQEPAIGPGGLAPEVVIGPNGLRFGTPANLSRQAYPDERRLDASDSFTLVTGRHALELGAQFSAIDDRIGTQANAAGTFRYDSTRTTANAGGLVDFITDQVFDVNTYPDGACPSINAPVHLFCFSSFTQSFGQSRVSFPTESYAFYLQDTWRPRPNLTLQAGLRYDYLLLPFPGQPNSALDTVFFSRAATSIFPEDRNNLGPHISLAASPFGPGRLTFRAAYATFFGRLPGSTLAAALSDTALPSSTLRVRITPSTITGCPQAPGEGFGYPCSFLSTPAGAVATTASAMVFDRRFRLPTVQQATLQIGGSLGAHTELSAAYLVNLDRQLPSSTDLNIAPSIAQASFVLRGGPSSGELFAVPLYTARVTPSYGPVTDIVSNVNATYNALLFTARTRLRTFLTADAQYTFSKALDTGAALTGTPRTNSQFDPFTHGYDKALSSLNFPQSFRLTALALAPRTHHRVLSGWEFAPVVLLRSGRPYSYQMFGGTRLAGGHLSINGSGGALYLPTVGRNTLRLPLAVQSNLRLARTFTLHGRPAAEPFTLRLAAEAFNLTNRLNLSSVEQRAYLVGTASTGVTPLVFQDAAAIAAEGLNTQAFATPTAASTSEQRERQLQLSLRIAF